MGIEPTSEAWEASILPLYDARSSANATKPTGVLQEFNGLGFVLECRVASGGWFGVPRPARVYREAGKGR
jgi:hypothetical protein